MQVLGQPRATPQLRLVASASLAAVCLLACPRDAAQVGEEFDALVADNADCDAAEDCTVIYTECPLDCFHAVRADRADEVEARAEQLVAEYELWGQACAYDCMAAGEPRCEGGTCAVDAVEEGG